MVRAADLELRTRIRRVCLQNRSFLSFEGVWTILRAPDCFRMVETYKKHISNLFLAYKHSVGYKKCQIRGKTGSLSSVNHPTQNSLWYDLLRTQYNPFFNCGTWLMIKFFSVIAHKQETSVFMLQPLEISDKNVDKSSL